MSIPGFADAVIVGGGPAGLAAAIALAQKGCHTTVVDCAIPPIDKACGEGLMPDSVAVLHQLGVTLPANAGFQFRGIRFCDAQSTVTADFQTGFGTGLRRTALHQILMRRAEECKVNIVWGVRNIALNSAGISADGQTIRSQLVVGADGQNSQIRRQAGLHQIRRERRRFGFRRHYRIAPWSQYVELYWGRDCQLYVAPVAYDEVCIVVISRDPSQRLDRAMENFPIVRDRLGSAIAVSSERGALSVSRSLKRVSRPGLALIGDASGSVDAVTGEGMCLAFQQALSLADAVESNRLENYERAHRSHHVQATNDGKALVNYGSTYRLPTARALRPSAAARSVRFALGDTCRGAVVCRTCLVAIVRVLWCFPGRVIFMGILGLRSFAYLSFASLLALTQLHGEELPSFAGETLSGKQILLPTAAKGRPTVFCVGFTRGSQSQTKNWAVLIGREFAADSRVTFYDAAVLEDAPRFMRGIIAHGIKSVVPAARYDHFLIIDNKEEQLKRAASFSNPNDAYVLLLDASGRIVSRWHGDVSQASMADLTAQVKGMLGPKGN